MKSKICHQQLGRIFTLTHVIDFHQRMLIKKKDKLDKLKSKHHKLLEKVKIKDQDKLQIIA